MEDEKKKPGPSKKGRIVEGSEPAKPTKPTRPTGNSPDGKKRDIPKKKPE